MAGSSSTGLPSKETNVLRGHEGAVLAVRFNGDGNYCLSCGKDRTVRLWNPHRGIHIKTYKAHARDVRDVHVTGGVAGANPPRHGGRTWDSNKVEDWVGVLCANGSKSNYMKQKTLQKPVVTAALTLHHCRGLFVFGAVILPEGIFSICLVTTIFQPSAPRFIGDLVLSRLFICLESAPSSLLSAECIDN
eukprot:Gb_17554 [translate_table: standard]